MAVEESGKLTIQESVGGLVTGIGSYLQSLGKSSSEKAEYLWIGSPGPPVPKQMTVELNKIALTNFHAYPVILPKTTLDKFYLGLCNKTLWPLFHYFPTYTTYDEDHWEHYRIVNDVFCDAALKNLKADDVVWIHDYHFMLLPELIRKKLPKISIGFFLHIPFPSYEIFRLLPAEWRTQLLNGLLGSDLIGFHTYDYTQYFLRCVSRMLGYEHDLGRIQLEDRMVKADTFPMGIDFDKFNRASSLQAVKSECEQLQRKLSGLRVILSVDRLDYSKGIVHRLRGYAAFLENNPSWRAKVVLLCVVVPSRIGVEHYRQMKSQVDELIGEINGQFGTIHWTPIIYQYKYLPFEALTALYSVSDVALVTPLRDGMNLIAKEYIATRVDKTGVLILSEMAGAFRELGEALIINPNSVEEIAASIKRAIEMTVPEQTRNMDLMQARIKQYDIKRWAEDFMENLREIRNEQLTMEARILNKSITDELIDNYRKSKHRLLLLDYDGTLVPFADYPELAKPTEELLHVLVTPSQDVLTDVVLISGREKKDLDAWFAALNIGLVAEHGAWIRPRGEDWRMIKPLVNDWKARILSILRTFSDRLPGSYTEEKDYSLAWHYRRADPEFASIRSKELIDDLVQLTANIDLQILPGNKVVEIRNAGVNKGAAALHWLSQTKYDFILAIGDDWTDEDIFRVLPENAYSIRVGMNQSRARFNLYNHLEVINLLRKLIS